MKTKKSTAFWASFFALLGIYFITLFANPEILKIIASTIIVGIVGAGVGFQGTNVADNRIKGKYYRPELDHPEEAHNV